MALPTILFNSGTGSDTAASGAGPGTALTGTGASLSASTSVDLSADSPDLSGVATDGSAVLWVKTSSGKQYGKITAVNNGTKIVTVANAYSVTESGKTWAIGGKRATLDHADSRILLTTSTGALAGWTIQLEDNQSIGSAIVGATSGDTTSGAIVIRGASEGIVLTQTANAQHFLSTGAGNPTLWTFENLVFKNSNGTKTSAYGLSANSGTFTFRRCILGDPSNTNNLLTGVARNASSPTFIFRDCMVTYCTSDGILSGNAGTILLDGCVICHCGSNGINCRVDTWMTIDSCLIWGNAADGLHIVSATPVIQHVVNCVFHGNSGDGIDIGAVHTAIVIQNNNITGNGNYGIRGTSGQSGHQKGINFNNYGTGGTVNTSGSLSNIDAGDSDLAVDPGYNDASNGDFTAGTSIKALGFPASSRKIGANPSTGTIDYVDVGIQRQESGGGGGGPLIGGRLVGHRL